MASVKGSKQLQMRVVPHRPLVELGIRLVVISTLLIFSAGAYYLGFVRGVDINGDARLERSELLTVVSAQDKEIALLKEQLLFSEQANIVDRQSLQNVQNTLVGQQDTIHQLEEDLLFYRSIMAPEDAERGLVIGLIEIAPENLTSGVYRYRLELRQQGDNENQLTGKVKVTIAGVEDGEEKAILLSEISTTEQREFIPFQFQYFQNIEGQLTLPGGFEPSKIQIVATLDGSNAIPLEKSVSWLAQTNAGAE